MIKNLGTHSSRHGGRWSIVSLPSVRWTRLSVYSDTENLVKNGPRMILRGYCSENPRNKNPYKRCPMVGDILTYLRKQIQCSLLQYFSLFFLAKQTVLINKFHLNFVVYDRLSSVKFRIYPTIVICRIRCSNSINLV